MSNTTFHLCILEILILLIRVIMRKIVKINMRNSSVITFSPLRKRNRKNLLSSFLYISKNILMNLTLSSTLDLNVSKIKISISSPKKYSYLNLEMIYLRITNLIINLKCISKVYKSIPFFKSNSSSINSIIFIGIIQSLIFHPT
jgi:hypothetical protein